MKINLNHKKLLLIIGVLLVICIAAMQVFDTSLKNEVCKQGIISFELAKEVSVSEAIIKSWNTKAKINAGLSLGFDFLFLLVYTSFIALLIYRINTKLWKGKPFYKTGVILIIATFLAGIFDVIENISLIKLLQGDLKQIWTSIAYYFAILKFGILILAILYLIFNWTFLLFKSKKINV